jgi:hypothetical protein
MMNRRSVFLPFLLALALAAGCASGPTYSKPTYLGGNGLSFNSPVIIVGAKSLEQGFAAEKQWLAQHYPDATKTGQQFLAIADRRYDVIDLTTANGQIVHVYFDVTDFLRQSPA